MQTTISLIVVSLLYKKDNIAKNPFLAKLKISYNIIIFIAYLFLLFYLLLFSSIESGKLVFPEDFKIDILSDAFVILIGIYPFLLLARYWLGALSKIQKNY
jgi:hypothetical protein